LTVTILGASGISLAWFIQEDELTTHLNQLLMEYTSLPLP
jgi:hypothetical protein